MRRRDFIKVIGGTAVFCPLTVLAQEPGRVYRLGALIPVPRAAPAIVAFLDEWWGAWSQAFTVTAPVDTGPVVTSVSNINTTAGQIFAAENSLLHRRLYGSRHLVGATSCLRSSTLGETRAAFDRAN
jgi:hypothetical protein